MLGIQRLDATSSHLVKTGFWSKMRDPSYRFIGNLFKLRKIVIIVAYGL
jgi:hypothetical protein